MSPISGPSTSSWRNRSTSGDAGGSRGTSIQGRRSGEILGITEEDEEEEGEEGDMFVEEVEDFKGALGVGEFVVEEEDEDEGKEGVGGKAK